MQIAAVVISAFRPADVVGTNLANQSIMPFLPHELIIRRVPRVVCYGGIIRGRRMRKGFGVLALLLGASSACFDATSAAAVVADAGSFPEIWQRLESVGGRGVRPSALAQSSQGDLAVGDEAGVSWWRGEVRERAALLGVRDLEFDMNGVLWIATLEGLYAWRSEARPERRRLQGGQAANRIHRIAVSHSALLIGTASGAYWSPDGKIFQMLRVGGAATAISQVAIRPARFDDSPRSEARRRSGQAQAWLYGNRRLSRVLGLEASSGLRVTDLRTLPLPRPASEAEPVDLRIDPLGERLFMVFEDLIAWRWIADPPSESSASGWRLERPALPPGAMIRALGWTSDRIWIATDHGLLSAESVEAPFRRSASPVGTTECFEIRATPADNPVALCRSGLYALGRSGSAIVGVIAAPRLDLPPDPPVAEIRRRALSRAGLTARRSHSLWDRLRQRAFWPEVGLHFDADFDFDKARDRDESFVSGDTRRLFDHSRDEGQHYQAAIEFDWDLGGVVYPLESVDLSRELRQVVSLRDDVADEINQLYFERQTIREQLANADTAPADARRLHWRASELDAGLDAWTGGWISQWRVREADQPSSVSVTSDRVRSLPITEGPLQYPDHNERRTRE